MLPRVLTSRIQELDEYERRQVLWLTFVGEVEFGDSWSRLGKEGQVTDQLTIHFRSPVAVDPNVGLVRRELSHFGLPKPWDVHVQVLVFSHLRLTQSRLARPPQINLQKMIPKS